MGERFFLGFEKKAMGKIDLLKDLGLKDREYCIVGGAVEVLGIRKSNDLDVLVIPEAFNRVARKRNLTPKRSFLGSLTIEIGDIELFSDDGFGRTANEWIQNSRVVNGLRIGSNLDLVRWKKKLMAKPGRNPNKLAQDAEDIKRLSS